MTKFLTFADEAQAREILAEYINEDGEWVTGGLYWSMLVLGVVYPEATEDNPNPEPYPGYGVNWAGNMPEYLEQYVVEIENPVNVFA
jgi:hypothetical protein